MPLLEEIGYMPKHKYSSGSELREYAESIVEKWQLNDKAMFQTIAKDLEWDDNEREWVTKLTQKKLGKEVIYVPTHTLRSECAREPSKQI